MFGAVSRSVALPALSEVLCHLDICVYADLLSMVAGAGQQRAGANLRLARRLNAFIRFRAHRVIAQVAQLGRLGQMP